MEVWELKLYFYPSAGGLKKKKKTATVATLFTAAHTRTAVHAPPCQVLMQQILRHGIFFFPVPAAGVGPL